MPKIYLDKILIPKHLDVIEDVLDHKHTDYVLYGGRGGAKSTCASVAIPLLIIQNPMCHAVVFRKVKNELTNSVFNQICWSIEKMGLSDLFRAKQSPLEITYIATGQKIFFRGLDDPLKAKSIKTKFGYIGITWFEELDQFNGRDELRNVQQSTQRGGEMFWNFETFNPPATVDAWVNDEIVNDDRGAYRLKTSYLDVPTSWLGQRFFDTAERLKIRNERAYRNEYLGEPTGTGGAVFENLVLEHISDEDIKGFDRVYCGLDSGYFPDPMALIKCNYNPATETIHIFDEWVQWKQSSMQTAEALEKHGIDKRTEVICDIDKKLIADLKSYGYSASKASKGQDSRRIRFEWTAKRQKIVIDPERCPVAAKEFRQYELEKNKDGKFISSYPDKNDHTIDATGYALNRIWKQGGQ